MSFTLKDLEYLIAVAEAGSFRAAAQQCGISQPTLSTQLAKLEDALDRVLMERGRNGIALTTAGQVAVEHAQRVLDEAQQLKAACRATSDVLDGPFRLGVIPTAGPYMMPSLLPAIRSGWPEVQLHLREEITETLLSRLRHGELDAAILSRPFDETGLAAEPLIVEPFMAIVPASHAFAKRSKLGIDDLQNVTMLLLEAGHCLREQTAGFCVAKSVSNNEGAGQLVQASSVESLRQMVAAGIGCSVLPQSAVKGRYAKMAGVTVVPLKPPVPSREMVLAWRQSHPAFGQVKLMGKAMTKAMTKTLS